MFSRALQPGNRVELQMSQASLVFFVYCYISINSKDLHRNGGWNIKLGTVKMKISSSQKSKLHLLSGQKFFLKKAAKSEQQ